MLCFPFFHSALFTSRQLALLVPIIRIVHSLHTVRQWEEYFLLVMNINIGLDFNNLGDSELQNLLNNMSQQQLMQVRMMQKTSPN